MARQSPSVTRFPATTDRQVLAGAAAWVLSALFFVDQAIVQAASTRPYSLVSSYISDLGNTACGPFSTDGYHADVCSPLHALMNGTFIAAGLLMLAGAVATRRAWPRRRLTRVGLVLVGLAGAGQFLVGLAPENVDLGLHTLGALFGILGLEVAMVLLGIGLVRLAPVPGALALACGIAGLAGVVLLQNGAPVGAAERLAGYPGAAMVVVFGAVLLRACLTSRAAGPGTRSSTA